MSYNYHERNLQRIENGELIGIEPSENSEFAFALAFNTYPPARPIKYQDAWLYEDILARFLAIDLRKSLKY